MYDYSLPFVSHLNAFLVTSYEELPVLDWACAFLSKFSPSRRRYQPQDLERLSQDDLKFLKSNLKNVRVTVSVPPGGRRARPIKDLYPDAGNYAFMKGEEETTIKVCSVIQVKETTNNTFSKGLLQREIRLQASVPKTVRHRRQCPAENDCPRGDLYDRWWADVQENAHAGPNVRGLATRCQKSARAARSDPAGRPRRCELLYSWCF